MAQVDLDRIRELLDRGRTLQAGREVAAMSLWQQEPNSEALRLQRAIGNAVSTAPDRIEPLLRRLLEELGDDGRADKQSVFIVHGWDQVLKLEAKNYFQNTLQAHPVVLHEQRGDGGTLIDKFERYAGECGLAVVLLSELDEPDERLASPDEERRPRPNVLFEMGYFFARLGRSRVILLRKGKVALHSDVLGIEWINVTNGVAEAGEQIRQRVPWQTS